MDFNQSAEYHGKEAAKLFHEGKIINGMELAEYRAHKLRESIGSLQSAENKQEWVAIFENSFNSENLRLGKDNMERPKSQFEIMGEKHGQVAANLANSGKLVTNDEIDAHKAYLQESLAPSLNKESVKEWSVGFENGFGRQIQRTKDQTSKLHGLDMQGVYTFARKHGEEAAKVFKAGNLHGQEAVTKARDAIIKKFIPDRFVETFKKAFEYGFRNEMTNTHQAATKGLELDTRMKRNLKKMNEKLSEQKLSPKHQRDWDIKGAYEAGAKDGEHSAKMYFRGTLTTQQEITKALHEGFAKSGLPESVKNHYAKAYITDFDKTLANMKQASIEGMKQAVKSNEGRDLKVGQQFTIKQDYLQAR